jgi:hypothetical protein
MVALAITTASLAEAEKGGDVAVTPKWEPKSRF